MKQKKFQANWASATDIGRLFGLSAIAVNKALEAKGLRDGTAKAPTAQALASGWAVATPLKDGTSHYMWSRSKVKALLAEAHQPLSDVEVALEDFVKAVVRLQKEAEDTGIDKLLWAFVEMEAPAIKRRGVTASEIRNACLRAGCKSQADEFIELLLGPLAP